MMFNYILVLSLAVLGASANFGYVSNGFNNFNGGYGALGGRVSDVCRCVKTVVRPQIRTEITSIPTVQRFVRTEATPVIERIPYSVSRRVDAPGYGVVSGGYGGVGVGGVGVGGVGVGGIGVGGVGVGGVGIGGVSAIGGIDSGFAY